jgi:hypothetical protein
MATNRPSNAPDATPDQPAEEASVAAVLNDQGIGERADGQRADGGLGGAAAAGDSQSGSARASEAQNPNNPASPPVAAPYPADDGAREAALQAVENPSTDAPPPPSEGTRHG